MITPSVNCHTRCPIVPHGESASSPRRRNCFVFTVKAVSVGFAELHVRFRESPPAGGSAANAGNGVVPMPTPISIVLAAFDPIQVSPPTIIVAEGTTIELNWLGGPLPWPRAGFSSTTGNQDPNAVTIGSRGTGRDAYFLHSGSGSGGLTSNVVADVDHAGSIVIKSTGSGIGADIHSYKLQCLSVHTQWLDIRVSNSPCASNPNPVTAHARIKFECYPRLKLHPDVLSLGVGSDKPIDRVSRRSIRKVSCTA